MANLRTHYDNLQVTRSASDAVIRAAYRSLSQKHHPDKNLGDRQNAERTMKAINESYEVLSDPTRRREYDAWIRQMETKLQSAETNTSSPANSTSATYDFVLYPSKKKISWMFLGSIVFVAIGVLLFLENKSENSWVKEAFRLLAIYLGVPFFGLCSVYCFAQLVNPSPSIVINEHGVQVMTFGGTTLRWSEIADIRIEEYQKKKFIALFPTNPDIVMQRQSLWGRIGTKFNASFLGRAPAIVIAEAMISMPLETLIGELKSRIPKT